jgi:hypothetical protein
MARSSSKGFWTEVIRAVNTPLSYYVLSLLIIEATLSLVVTKANLDPTLRWVLCISMIVFMAANLAVVTTLNFKDPKSLLFGKEEHSAPQIDPSALKDQIEDIIAQNVRPECLKKDP